MNVDSKTALNIMANLLKIKNDRRLSSVTDPVAFYGFRPEDVNHVHFRSHGIEGTWFRLKDGRVIDSDGIEDTSDTFHKLPD